MSDLRHDVAAIRSCQDELASIVIGLDESQLESPSYDTEWNVAQVLSHLGSSGEIFGLWLDAAVQGSDPPGREAFEPIWAVWNAKAPADQAADAIVVGETLLRRFDTLSDEQLGSLHLSLFGRDLDAAGLIRMRLGEFAVHTWDVAVSFDPSATVSAAAVPILIDMIAATAGRGKPAAEPSRIAVRTSEPTRRFVLNTGGVLLEAAGEGEAPDGHLIELPAEAFIRLVYGRLDPVHTPPLHAEGVELDELRQVFPGF